MGAHSLERAWGLAVLGVYRRRAGLLGDTLAEDGGGPGMGSEVVAAGSRQGHRAGRTCRTGRLAHYPVSEKVVLK